jgi:hypothetical protein
MAAFGVKARNFSSNFFSKNVFKIIVLTPCSQTALQLLIAVVRYQSKLVEPRRGLCSNWITTLKPGDNLTIPKVKPTTGNDQENRPNMP